MITILAVTLLLQDSPADFLKKVEQRYADAKSFTVSAEAVGKGHAVGRKPTESRMTGSFKSKGDGKVYVDFTGKVGESEIPKTVAVSDGSKLHCGIQQETKVVSHTLAMGSLARVGFVRGGLFGAAGALVFWAHNPGLPLGKLFDVTKVADAGTEKVGERNCRVITYTLSSNMDSLRTTTCKVWIDPEKLVVLKRELTNETGTISETYSDPVFDGEVDDSAFKIP